MRRSGRTVPDQAYEHFAPFDLTTLDEILEVYDHDPKRMLQILEATQAAFGHLPVAALKRISERTGAWYAMIYGTASYYGHLRFEPPAAAEQRAEVSARRPSDESYLAALGASLGGRRGGGA
jgi:NADH:ubiquinone oxidoreductase subunit E